MAKTVTVTYEITVHEMTEDQIDWDVYQFIEIGIGQAELTNLQVEET